MPVMRPEGPAEPDPHTIILPESATERLGVQQLMLSGRQPCHARCSEHQCHVLEFLFAFRETLSPYLIRWSSISRGRARAQ